jgi:hypothetical protein
MAAGMHTSTHAAIWKRQQSQLRVLQTELSSDIVLPRRPSQPVLRNSRGVEFVSAD